MCSNFLETRPDNQLTVDQVIENPALAEGWILKAYRGLPNNYNFDADFASDDAVTNDPSSNVTTMNLGGWTSDNNPLEIWSKAYEMNLYLNTFLQYADEIEYSWTSETKDSLFALKLKGEAYGLRGYWNSMLLLNHAGVGVNGELLGFPIVDHVLGTTEDYKIPRSSFKACVDYIVSDLDKAIEMLPVVWEDGEDADYTAVMGERNANRINGISAMLIKSRVLLMAASPAFAESGFTMQEAAEAAAAVMIEKEGISSLKSADIKWYENFKSDEILWSSTKTDNTHNWEDENLPPSLFGDGRLNPTQELVNAFPMSDGMPIFKSSDYDANNPYLNRDSRLEKYIVVNNSKFGGDSVKTSLLSGEDAIGGSVNATRTGYYIRKFMNESVKINPASTVVGAAHFYTYARYTEALLNFAEAANEAGGPDYLVGEWTAREVINAIRKRAGLSNDYVESITGKNEMRELILNERRIEMCFEGFRFWDIRRNKLTDAMKQPVSGAFIAKDLGSVETKVVEKRQYADYQIYGPIPFDETLKYDIVQNQGW